MEFKAATSFFAGYPYLVYSEAPTGATLYKQDVSIIATPKYDQYTETETGHTATFHGSFAPMTAGDLEGFYGVTDVATLAKGSDQATMKGFRGYFELPAGAEGVRIKIPGGTVGIATTPASALDGKAYNLGGQRVTKAGRGILIVDGKKVFKK